MRFAKALAVFALAVALGGCMVKGPSAQPLAVNLPKAPSYYRACFEKLTDIPIEKLSRERVVLLVADLRKSEMAKSRCGKDLLAWYSTVRAAYMKAK